MIQAKDEGRCRVYFFVIHTPIRADTKQVQRQALPSMGEPEGFEVNIHEIRLRRLVIIVLHSNHTLN